MQSNRQSGNYECGYYVMQWMLTILQVAINKGWDQVIPQYNKHFKDYFLGPYILPNKKNFRPRKLTCKKRDGDDRDRLLSWFLSISLDESPNLSTHTTLTILMVFNLN